MDRLVSLARAALADQSRYCPWGIVVLLLGAALAFPASHWARGNENRALVFRIAGLLLALIGTIVTLKVF